MDVLLYSVDDLTPLMCLNYDLLETYRQHVTGSSLAKFQAAFLKNFSR